MGNTFYFEWEVKLMEGIQNHMNAFTEFLSSFITFLGKEYVIIAVLGFLLWCYDKETGKKLGRDAMVGMVSFAYIKNIALRRRPYFDHEKIKCLVPVDANADIYDIAAQGYSCPSGHSTNSTIAYGALAYYYKNKLVRIIGIILPILIGISRFAVGVHYPTDVMAGWLLGLIIIFGMDWLFSHVKNKAAAYLIFFIISATGCLFSHTTDYFTGLGMMAGFYLGDLYEEKYVKYENAKGIKEGALRLAIGFALFGALNIGLKLPFPKEFLESATALSFFVRTIRYALTLFIMIGLYPRLFKRIENFVYKKQ